MQVIEIIYLTASAGSVIAMAPQVKQLLVTKQSDELSLVTWIAWTFTQVVAFVYSIMIHAVPFIITNVAWITFYIIMLTLIIKYRKKPTQAIEISNSISQPNRQLATVPVSIK